jgi:DNA-directed RNA polymerase subunit RPC12/RpoP
MGFDGDSMHHMMDWDSSFWLFLVFAGVISFFLIILILIYTLRKKTNEFERNESPIQPPKQKELRSSQHLDEIKFCPECGVKLDENNIAYCPACGHKI